MVLLNKIKSNWITLKKLFNWKWIWPFFQLFFSLIESSFSVVEHISSVDEAESRDQFVNLSKTNVYSANLCFPLESTLAGFVIDIIINQRLNFGQKETEYQFMMNCISHFTDILQPSFCFSSCSIQTQLNQTFAESLRQLDNFFIQCYMLPHYNIFCMSGWR